MSLLVRDEIDFVAENIAFHAAHGVDCFVVVDNGSRDGTRERVAALRRDYDIEIVDEPATDYRQDVWTTEAARRIAASGKADYVISNDADEFWVAASGNLKDALVGHAAVAAPRSNLLPFADEIERPDFRFFDAVMRVVAPYPEQPARPDPREPLAAPAMLRRLPPKIACRLDGLRAIGMGNHTVDHATGGPAIAANLQVYHFPLRPYRRFIDKVGFARECFAQRPDWPPSTLWHWRRWVAQQDFGLLEAEYRSYPLDRAHAAALEAQGVVARDETIRRFFRS